MPGAVPPPGGESTGQAGRRPASGSAGAPARWSRGPLAPVDYSARSRYRRPPWTYRRLQPLATTATRWGLSPRDVVVVEVPGRRSGIMRTTTVVLLDRDRERFLVALAGEADWVRNVRAAQGHAVLGRRRRRAVTLVELPVSERAPVLRSYLTRGGRRPGSAPAAAREARAYLGVGADPALAELAAAAAYYPVFRVLPGWRWPPASR